jgi:hypothetical protein
MPNPSPRSIVGRFLAGESVGALSWHMCNRKHKVSAFAGACGACRCAVEAAIRREWRKAKGSEHGR